MRFRSLSRWSADPCLDGLKFFAQRLEELLFDYTLDSYKPSALNAPYLAGEAISLIADIESGVIDFANLSHVLEELVWSVQNDKVAKGLLDSDIEYYTNIANESELPALKLRLEVLERSINPLRYLNATLSQLERSIQAIEKSPIDTLARMLVTTLVNMGLSKQYLYDCVQICFFNEGPAIEDVSYLDNFIKLITPKTHSFQVLLIASKNIQPVADSIGAFKLKISSTAPEGAEEIIEKTKFKPTENELYVVGSDIRAHDPYGAREAAIRSMDNLSDLISLFLHRAKITWREPVVVIKKCCSNEAKCIEAPRGAMDRASDLRPEKAAKELNNLLKSFSAKGLSFSKFNRVADIHGICVNHPIIDNQLINLWTALETLTPSHSGASKISNITSATLPFLLHFYIQRLVQQISYDLMNWDKWRVRKILQKVKCDPKTSLLGKCLRLLCLEENEPLRQGLYEHLKDFHLLRYRFFKLSETLSDKKKVQKLFALHEKKVSWQLRRIYRARNLIVHSGRTPPPYIDTLVENGHHYLDLIVFEVMRLSCGDYRASTLEQIFEIAKVRYTVFSKKLSEIDTFTSDNCEILIGAS
ncbi:MAG TPA: hypothetical protein VGK09_01355 [Rhodocyclaceae bacterium]|jgi:hypothetical protein